MEKRWIVMLNTSAASKRGGYGWELQLCSDEKLAIVVGKTAIKDRDSCRQAIVLCVEEDRTLTLYAVLGDPLTQAGPQERILPYSWGRYSQMLATAYYIVCSGMPPVVKEGDGE